mgnify:FL=1
MSAANERNLTLGEPAEFEVQVGAGISAVVGGRAVVIGNVAQMERLGIDPSALNEVAESRRREGAGIMFIAVDGMKDR